VNWLEQLHGRYVADRRARTLAQQVAKITPNGVSVLDVGCGDGELASELSRLRPDLQIRGTDVLLRPHPSIEVTQYDGQHLNEDEGGVDVVLMVDTIHHSEDPDQLLLEACRVARQNLIIKDHRRNGLWAETTLRFMDRTGNARYGVALPYTYWSEAEWREKWAERNLRVELFRSDLHLYPQPFGLFFDRGLHFLARLGLD
jgi:SAM-dependent methyltransferase